MRGEERSQTKMPTCLSPVVELLVEAEQQRLNRVQSQNNNLQLRNEELEDQIRDLRYHLHMQREVQERRRRWFLSRQARLRNVELRL